MAKKRQPNRSKKQTSKKPKQAVRQSPEQLWGKKWRVIKFIASLLGFVIIWFTIFQYRQMNTDGILTTNIILAGFLLDFVLVVAGYFFLKAPISPLRLYGTSKHRWLFGWIFFMGVISHFIANVIGLLIANGTIS